MKKEAVNTSVIAPHATENILQVLKNNTVSYCGIVTDVITVL